MFNHIENWRGGESLNFEDVNNINYNELFICLATGSVGETNGV